MPGIPSFKGLTAVVTGASSGMGRELAVLLAREGCHLALCDVSMGALEETKAIIVSRSDVLVTVHNCDVASTESIVAFRAAVEAAHPNGWHLLFNNAGVAGTGPFLDMPKAMFDKIFDVSFVGVVECTRQFLPRIVEQPYGAVVNTSSINAFWSALGPAKWPVETPPHAPYSAAKAAIRAFTDALLVDSYQNFPHVTVACVHPGHVGTGIARMELSPGGPSEKQMDALKDQLVRNGLRSRAQVGDMSVEEMQDMLVKHFKRHAPTSARDAARSILKGVQRGDSRILIGEDAVVVDWLARLFPRLMYNDTFFLGVFFPWMMGARAIGAPLGRFLYPVVMGSMLFLGLGRLRGRL
jgi:NAD(P)-dependent dehydrogenase (short-subunit alcohol dehydrogenase family)